MSHKKHGHIICQTANMNQIIPRDLASGVSICHLTQVVSSVLPRTYDLLGPEPASDKMPQSSIYEEALLAGSRANRLRDGIRRRNKEIQHPSDADLLLIMSCPCKVGLPDNENTHLVVDTSDTKPGYLRLEHIPRRACGERNTETCTFRTSYGIDVEAGQNQAPRTYISLTKSKPSLAKEIEELAKKTHGAAEVIVTCTGPAVNVSFVSTRPPVVNCRAYIDYSSAIKSQTWPSVAEEWLTRKRPSGWISCAMLDDIRNNGCYFVQVPHRESTCPDIEWRFSFTYGELKLAHSLTESQRRCFVTFKTLIHDKLQPNSAISSYCLKNILFWTLDQIPTHVWETYWSGQGMCFLVLLDQLIHCLINHNIPHYFMPETNLIGHRPREMIRTALQQVVLIRQNPVAEILEFDKKFPPLLSAIPVPLHDLLGDFIKTGLEQQQTFKRFLHNFITLCFKRLDTIILCGIDTGEEFSHVIHDASRVSSNFLWLFMDKFQLHTAMIGIQNEAVDLIVSTMVRTIWYCLIHLLHNRDKPLYEDKLATLKSTFVRASSQAATFWSPRVKLVFYTRLAVLLHMSQDHEGAIDAAKEVISLASSDLVNRLIENGISCYWNTILFSKYSSVAFHPSLQPLTKSSLMTACLVPSKCIAYHTLIQCYLDSNATDKAREVLQSFKDHCERLDTLEPDTHHPASLFILAQNQQMCGYYLDAIEAYNKIEELPQANEVDYASDKIFCSKKLDILASQEHTSVTD